MTREQEFELAELAELARQDAEKFARRQVHAHYQRRQIADRSARVRFDMIFDEIQNAPRSLQTRAAA